MKLLIDSDALFGLFVPTDPHHVRAKSVYIREIEKGTRLTVLNLVIQETATVLSHKVNQRLAVDFIDKFRELDIPILTVDEDLALTAWKIFRAQTKKGTSFVDCANMAVIGKYKLDGIITFDEFYPKGLMLQ